MKKKFLCLVLALAMLLSLVACGGNNNTPTDTNNPPADTNTPADNTPDDNAPADGGYTGPDWAAIDAMDADGQSDALYDWNLGEFASYYAAAKTELDDLDKRAALMAVAEAKLLESGVFVPLQSNGGAFAISRVVPRSQTGINWGLDKYKWFTILVANELIKTTDRDALTALWVDAPDAGSYVTSAKQYLADNGYTLNDTYNFSTSYKLNTWDMFATSQTSDSYFVAPTYSSLLEYDIKNVQQPALAESYEVSDDGTVYTFHIRDGVYWVDQQGRQLEQVTAHDWVTGMMHVADNTNELGFLMSADGGVGIKNYDAYINGEVPFEDVGVKALDDLTLEYTLEQKFPSFLTALGYACFGPLNYNFYKSQGGTFGAEGDTYTAGNYGTSPSTIAYCGPYLITNYTENNITAYSANPSYWNPDAMNVHAVNIYFDDSSDVTRSYTEAKANVIAGTGLNSSALVLAKDEIPDGESESYFDLYHYTSATDTTSFVGWLNLNRKAFANANDDTKGISPRANDADAQARTRAAMNNQHFRLALAYGFDRGGYVAQARGDELKYTSMINSYVPGTFVQFSADTTVDINGTATTFPAGSYYGEVLQAQLEADGYAFKVWDPTADGGVGSSAGFDGWYNPDAAKAEIELAIAELAQVGVEISAENPIIFDLPVANYGETYLNQANAYKQSIESVLEGKVTVNLVGYEDNDSYGNSYYRIQNGAEANYDEQLYSGWGPDYGDPQSYLDTIQAYGYMCKNIGLY
ncbi:MAG: peptide ABC transporter substrate-binding protein [Oscillospiraceae bacterium]|nr:peptide ABC transporter substrate-binding protein [Oscillospiraceae bacterium]